MPIFTTHEQDGDGKIRKYVVYAREECNLPQGADAANAISVLTKLEQDIKALITEAETNIALGRPAPPNTPATSTTPSFGLVPRKLGIEDDEEYRPKSSRAARNVII